MPSPPASRGAWGGRLSSTSWGGIDRGHWGHLSLLPICPFTHLRLVDTRMIISHSRSSSGFQNSCVSLRTPPPSCADLVLTLGTTSGSCIVPYFPCTGPRKSPFSKEPWFTLWQSLPESTSQAPRLFPAPGVTCLGPRACVCTRARTAVHLHTRRGKHEPTLVGTSDPEPQGPFRLLTLNPRVPSGFLSC